MKELSDITQIEALRVCKRLGIDTHIPAVHEAKNYFREQVHHYRGYDNAIEMAIVKTYQFMREYKRTNRKEMERLGIWP